MKIFKRILAPLVVLTAALTAYGEDPQIIRPVISVYSLEVGSGHITDTYLSPLHYSGKGFALNYERLQAMKFDPERWTMRLNGRLGFEYTENTVRNASIWDLDIEFRWGMMRRFKLDKGWEAGIGGSTNINGGLFYNGRNSNNPVAAQAAWNINLSAQAVWHTSLLRKDVTFRYLVESPLTGVFFCPEYDELYYEIWLGNHSGLVHGAWPGNYFRLDNLLTADIRLGSTILRLGYNCRILSSKANEIVTQRITHTAVIGIASEWISLSAKGTKGLDKARVISALY